MDSAFVKTLQYCLFVEESFNDKSYSWRTDNFEGSRPCRRPSTANGPKRVDREISGDLGERGGRCDSSRGTGTGAGRHERKLLLALSRPSGAPDGHHRGMAQSYDDERRPAPLGTTARSSYQASPPLADLLFRSCRQSRRTA